MGSKGSTTTNYNQTAQQTPNPYTAAAGQQALIGAQGAAQQPFWLPPAPVAGFSPMQQSAFQNINAVQGQAQPWYNQAGQFAIGSQTPITGADVSQYYNPMAANVTAQLQNIFGQQNVQNTGNLVQSAGGVGADRIAVGQANLANQQGLAAGQTYAGLYQQALQAAEAQKQQQANAAYAMGNLGKGAQAANLQGIQAQLGAGGLQQQLAQAQLQSPYNWLQQQFAYPYQANQYLAGIAGGLGPAMGGTTTGQSQTTTTPPQPSPISQLLGLGTAGLGMIGGVPGLTNAGYNPFAPNSNFNIGNPYTIGNLTGGQSYGDPSMGSRGGRMMPHRATGGTSPFLPSKYTPISEIPSGSEQSEPTAPSSPQLVKSTPQDEADYFNKTGDEAAQYLSEGPWSVGSDWQMPQMPAPGPVQGGGFGAMSGLKPPDISAYGTQAYSPYTSQYMNLAKWLGGKGSAGGRVGYQGGGSTDPWGSVDNLVPDIALHPNAQGEFPNIPSPQQSGSGSSGSGKGSTASEIGTAAQIAMKILPMMAAQEGGRVIRHPPPTNWREIMLGPRFGAPKAPPSATDIPWRSIMLGPRFGASDDITRTITAPPGSPDMGEAAGGAVMFPGHFQEGGDTSVLDDLSQTAPADSPFGPQPLGPPPRPVPFSQAMSNAYQFITNKGQPKSPPIIPAGAYDTGELPQMPASAFEQDTGRAGVPYTEATTDPGRGNVGQPSGLVAGDPTMPADVPLPRPNPLAPQPVKTTPGDQAPAQPVTGDTATAPRPRPAWSSAPPPFGQPPGFAPRAGTAQALGPRSRSSVQQDTMYYANKYGVPTPIAMGLVQQESGFQSHDRFGRPLTSSAGAIGPAQLMPGTARGLGVNPYDPTQNIAGGMQYLRQQYDRFGNWPQALAAYNAGPGRIAGGGPLPAETRNYVPSVMANARNFAGGNQALAYSPSMQTVDQGGEELPGGAEPTAYQPLGGPQGFSGQPDYGPPGLGGGYQPTVPYNEPYPGAGQGFGSGKGRNLVNIGASIAGQASPWAGVNIGRGLAEATKIGREEVSSNQAAQRLWQEMQKHVDTMTRLTPQQQIEATRPFPLGIDPDTGAMRYGIRTPQGAIIDATTGRAIFQPGGDLGAGIPGAGVVPTQEPGPRDAALDKFQQQDQEAPKASVPELQSDLLPTKQPGMAMIAGPFANAEAQPIRKFNDEITHTLRPALTTQREQLDRLKGDYTTLMQDPKTGQGFFDSMKNFLMLPGSNNDPEFALGKMRQINNIKTAAGLAPEFDPKKIAAMEEMVKIQKTMGMSFAGTISSRDSQQMQLAAISAQPGLTQSPQGVARLIGMYDGLTSRGEDRLKFWNRWQQVNPRRFSGWDDDFESKNPVSRTTVKSIIDNLPNQAAKDRLPDAVKLLQGNRNNPDIARKFDQVYGPGMSSYFLTGQYNPMAGLQ